MSYDPYEIILTVTAFDLMSDREQAEALARAARESLDDAVPDDHDPGVDIIFHVFEHNERRWMILPTRLERTLMVAPARFVEHEIEAEGNFGPGGVFEGKALMMPEPDLDQQDIELLSDRDDEGDEDEDGSRTGYH